MAKRLILHFCSSSPITKSYIEFVNSEFNPDEHYFIIFETSFKYEYPDNTYFINTKNSKVAYLKLIHKLFKCNKLILHGFFQISYITRLLTIFPMFTKKTTWVPWGGDFYDDIEKLSYTDNLKYKIFFYFKKRILKKVPYYATYLPHDFYLAQQFYQSKAKLIEYIMYPSNLFKEVKQILPTSKKEKIILVGNSASRANNHIESLYKLSTLNIDMSYKIICPLSYGDLDYQQEVITTGNFLFAGKFIPLIEILDSVSYSKLLSSIDIALFNHNRQEGMGTTITLLGMGKKVYLQDNTSQWLLFRSLNITVFDINTQLNSLFSFDTHTAQGNIDKIKHYFSYENLIKQSKNLFYK